jgi:hypothetical protein
MLDLSKEKQVGKKYSRIERAIPESALQQVLDELLIYKHIRCVRIPDGIFRWVKMNTPPKFQSWFFGMFAAWPDNLLLMPTGKGYLIGYPIELKRVSGKLHGRQKNRSKEQDWIVCRSTTEIINEVNKAETLVQSIKEKP